MSKATSSSTSNHQYHSATTTTTTKGRRHRREEEEEEEDLAPVDTGLIRCICPSTEDDGFTIQCERCLVWQHAYCVRITHASIPDHYLCDQCSKRKRPKLSKRIPISKKRLKKLDSEDDPSFNNKKKKHVKSRIVSRYVHPIFREAKERWSQSSRWKQPEITSGPILYDHGPFVTMDATTLLTKGVLIDTPVSNQGLFATRSIPSLRYLMEVTGDVMLKSEFKFDPINDFVILGTPLSHIMFYPTLDLCIDTRQFGNKARYIRRSCHPNAELRNVVLPRGSSGDDKTIHLGLFARHLIEKGQEVTISWNWQRGHIAWKENMNWHHQHKVKQGQDDEVNQVIDEEEERRRKATIQTMLDRFEKEFGSCACVNKKRCLIEQLRRQVAPPKEKLIFKLPAQVNILPPVTTTNEAQGRRKSSVILLKPKSQPEKKLVNDIANPNSRQTIVSPTNSTKLKNGVEESSADIDVTSNSPTLGPITTTKKDASDDELLDIDGDIDIGDDLPGATTNSMKLPLLDDSNSDDDDDNADLSSLSSLSSLSVFEESGNDMTDDEENRIKQRRKKYSSRYGKSSRPHHHHSNHATSFVAPRSVPSSSTTPVIEKKASPVVAPAVLPRKKLWMRDYLNKHVASSDQTSKSPDAQTQTSDQQQLKTEETNNNISVKAEDEPYTTANSSSTTEKEPITNITTTSVEGKNDSMDIDDEPTAGAETTTTEVQVENKEVAVEVEANATIVETKETTETLATVTKEEEKMQAVVEDAAMAEADDTNENEMDVEPELNSTNNVLDIDDGELSDASTILLDEEELRQVYNRRDSVDQQTPAQESSIVDREAILAPNVEEETLSIEEENIAVVDDEEVQGEEEANKEASTTMEEADTEEIEVDISEETTRNGHTAAPVDKEQVALHEAESKLEKDPGTVAPVANESETKPPPVKKISLQEYLSSNKKASQTNNHL